MRLALLMFALAGCGRVGFASSDVDAAAGGGVDGAAAACGPWGAPTHLPEVSSVFTDWSPALDPTGLVLVIGSNRGQAGYDLWVATRATASATFGAPVLVPVLGSAMDETGATFSGDGSALYFLSGGVLWRLGHQGGGVFADQRTVDGFPGVDFALSPDDLELFTSKVEVDGFDVGHATRASLASPWVEDADAAALNRVGVNDGWPVFDARTQTIYFERSGVDDTGDLARATRPGPGQPFAPPEDIAELSDLGIWYADPTMSVDGTILIFAADYPGTLGNHDLYQVTRTCR